MGSLIDEATIKIRRDTSGNWNNNNPIAKLGEWCLETDTGLVKIGDGSNNWNDLDYYVGSESMGTSGQVLTSNGAGSAPSMEDPAFKNDGTQNLTSKGIDDNATDTAITIDSAGAVTMQNQPAFNVYMDPAQDNIKSEEPFEFDTERFDRGGDFNTNTFQFTAPISGVYQFNVVLTFNDIDSNRLYLRSRLKTSNKEYTIYVGDNVFTGGDVNYLTIASFSILCDMDANDTAKVYVYQSGGAVQMDEMGSSFSGFLVA